ncbi:MAG: RHS repeat-associated core domain-containing protein [Leptospiraceae bacterium]|nr:RHS repeat-associated core domain-containing protein [Leptospiraceae bacterium]
MIITLDRILVYGIGFGISTILYFLNAKENGISLWKFWEVFTVLEQIGRWNLFWISFSVSFFYFEFRERKIRKLFRRFVNRNFIGIQKHKGFKNKLHFIRENLSDRTRFILLSFSVITLVTLCGRASSGNGTPPWILLGNGVTNETLGVQQQGYMPGQGLGTGVQGSGTGGLPNGVVPVEGMYFFHPDHLGSTVLVTDGYGNVVSGGTFGGKSNIIYKPYGEIDRVNSTGPDITRFKFTGQEEDKEVGLLYYKARYYDPMLGRFLSPDNYTQTGDVNGMNQYMYVGGSPLNYRDPTGNLCAGNYYALIGFAIGGPVFSAGIGVYKNYTGGGLSCSGGKLPDEQGAMITLIASQVLHKNMKPEEKALLMLSGYYYYKHQYDLGEPTFINRMTYEEQDLFYATLFSQIEGNSDEANNSRIALMFSYNYMRLGGTIVEPQGGIDRCSFYHDKSGSGITRPSSRTANKNWMDCAWGNANGPGDYMAAATGTVVFTTANLVNDYFDNLKKFNNWKGDRTGLRIHLAIDKQSIQWTPPRGMKLPDISINKLRPRF